MAITEMQAQTVVDVQTTIGEAPVWDHSRQRWLWVDLAAGALHQCAAAFEDRAPTLKTLLLPGPLCLAVPRAQGGLIAAVGSELLAVADDGRTRLLRRVEELSPELRFNDGSCDPMGRLWVGTASTVGRPDAALYRFDADGSFNKVLDQLTMSNGLGWSPDGRRFYHTDSFVLGIDAHDLDMASGQLHNRRRLITVERGAGLPDGLCVDEEGYLWVALFFAGQIRRYSPAGEWVSTIRVSARQTTSCAFGGPDMDELLITSAKVLLPDWLLSLAGIPPGAEHGYTSPHAGNLFRCRPGVRGLKSTPFAG